MEEKVEGSVYHEHRKRVAKQNKESKKKSEVLEEWVEVGVNTGHQHGKKLVKCTKTKAGTFRQLIGRDKDPKFTELVAKLKQKYTFKNL